MTRSYKTGDAMRMGPTLDNTFGAGLIGANVSVFLYGVTFAQIVRFLCNPSFNTDSKILRYTMEVLWVLDTAHVGCTAYGIYYLAVILREQITLEAILGVEFGSSGGSQFVHAQRSIAVAILLAVMNDLFIRGIWLSRIFIISKKSFGLCVPLGLIVAASTGIGTYCAVLYYGTPISVVFFGATLWPVLACLTVSALADITMSVVLCLLFRSMSHESEMTQPLLDKLSRYVIGCGILPSVISLAALVSYIVFHDTQIYMGIYCTASKASLNSMLYMLNARQSLREVNQEENIVRAQACLEVGLKEGGVSVNTPTRLRRRATTIVQSHSA